MFFHYCKITLFAASCLYTKVYDCSFEMHLLTQERRRIEQSQRWIEQFRMQREPSIIIYV